MRSSSAQFRFQAHADCGGQRRNYTAFGSDSFNYAFYATACSYCVIDSLFYDTTSSYYFVNYSCHEGNCEDQRTESRTNGSRNYRIEGRTGSSCGTSKNRRTSNTSSSRPTSTDHFERR